MSVKLNTLKLDSFTKLGTPEADEALISKAFNEFVSQPEFFRIKRLNNGDRGVLGIVVVAIGALIYLVATNNFFNNQALSYSAIALVGLGILRLGYRQYCFSKCKEQLYIAFALLVYKPYLDGSPRAAGNPSLPFGGIKDMTDARNYSGLDEKSWWDSFDTAEFTKRYLQLRLQLSCFVDFDRSKLFLDVFKKDDPVMGHGGITLKQFLQQKGIDLPDPA